MNYRKLRPSLIALSVIFLCLLPIALGVHGRLARQHDWQELGPNSAQGAGVSGYYRSLILRSVVIAPDESVYLSWRDSPGDIGGIDRIAKWNGRAWKSTHIPNVIHPILSETLQIAATPDNQLAVVWRGPGQYEGEIIDGIFVGLWDGFGWRLLGNGSVVPVDELDELRWRDSFQLTVAPDNKLYLIWNSVIDKGWKINMKVWNGATWETVESNLEQFIVDRWWNPFMIVAPDGVLYLAWSHTTGHPYDNSREIYLMKRDGDQWTEVSPGSASEGGISQSYSRAADPYLAIAADGSLYLSWVETGRRRIKRWDGTMWTEIGHTLSTSDGVNNYGSNLAIAADQIYVTWAEDAHWNRQIYVQRWDSLQWRDVGYDASKRESVSQNRSYSSLPQIAATEGKVCVAWIHSSHGMLRIRPYLEWNQSQRRPYFFIEEGYDFEHSIYARCYFE